MRTPRITRRTALLAPSAALLLAACSSSDEDPDAAAPAPSEEHDSSGSEQDAHAEHDPDGGPPPAGIAEAADPTYPVGSEVLLGADHMPGMDGAAATISGAFTTTTYSVSYTPTDGGDPVTDHRWVVHEELVDPGEAPLPEGAEVELAADHMPGMEGATATIDSATDETAYMVDYEMDGMAMTNHKWVVESEIQPAS